MKKVFKEAEIKDLISKVSGNEITFSRFVEILNEKVEDSSKPSEDIKQVIEEVSKDHADIYCDPTDEVIEVTKYLIFSWVKESFIAGAKFALRLSENSDRWMREH